MNTAHRERGARRIPVQYPIYYSNGTFQTIGVTEDFNASGGRIRGKEQVSVGMELALSGVPPQSESELKAMAKVMLPGLWSCLN